MAAEPHPPRWRRLAAGVRFRTTAVAIAVVGLVLVVAVAAVALQTRRRLAASITDAAEARAIGVATLVEAAAAPDPLPAGGGIFAQVVGADGRVIAASSALRGLGPLSAAMPPPGEMVRLETDAVFEPVEDIIEIEDEGPYRVVALGVDGPDGPVTVQVAASLEPARAAFGAISPLLLAFLPLVLAAVGVTVWRLTGRALRPIESMRREATAISATDRNRRLPVPETHDEVQRLAATLNDMLDRLARAAERQRLFVADASHELKSPVAAIRTMLEVAHSTPDFDDWAALVGDLMREDLRLEAIVGDLLILARADEGALARRAVEVDLDQVVGREAEAVAATFRGRVDATGLEAIRVRGDRDALGRLFRNLLDNAARHAASAVWVESEAVNGEVVVAVSDDGAGIRPADRERIFERFVRLDDEGRSRAHGGTGLGLAVARAVARSHRGDVRVGVSRHGGATLEVHLPADVSAADG